MIDVIFFCIVLTHQSNCSTLSKSNRAEYIFGIANTSNLRTMIDCNVDGLLKVKHAKIPFPYSFFSPINYDFDIGSEIQFSTGFFFAHFFFFISIEYSSYSTSALPSSTQRCISKKRKKRLKNSLLFFPIGQKDLRFFPVKIVVFFQLIQCHKYAGRANLFNWTIKIM